MINYLIVLVFIFAIAITSGSILISSHLRFTYKTNFFSTLLFFQIFYFTFGFYALWGQMIEKTFLAPYVSHEILRKITDLTVLLGTPFLIFASLMFIRFSKEITGRKTSNVFVLWYLLLNLLFLIAIGYVLIQYPKIKNIEVMKDYYIILNTLYILLISIFLLKTDRRTKLRFVDLRNLTFGLLLNMILQNTILLFYHQDIYLALIFIFLFFVLGGFVPFHLKYKADLSKLLPEMEISKSFEKFCEKFEISKREKEIIHEICKGYSNQQIAEKLFISLQTVKDHTHRIYNKTVCTSRSQLIYMLKESFPE